MTGRSNFLPELYLHIQMNVLTADGVMSCRGAVCWVSRRACTLKIRSVPTRAHIITCCIKKKQKQNRWICLSTIKCKYDAKVYSEIQSTSSVKCWPT